VHSAIVAQPPFYCVNRLVLVVYVGKYVSVQNYEGLLVPEEIFRLFDGPPVPAFLWRVNGELYF